MGLSHKFVSIDGPNGVGKTTVATALAKILQDKGSPVYLTAEPSTCSIGRLARAEVDQYTGKALACLVAADRWNHVEREIIPAIRAGRIVISDRYLASSIVLQGFDGVNLDYVFDLHRDIPNPDLCVVLLADAHEVKRRLAARTSTNRFERSLSPEDEVARYARAAQTLEARGLPVLVVQNNASIDETVAVIFQRLVSNAA